MPRIRTIKPEFWDDEKLATIPRDARLTFIGMWNHSDDYGVVKGHSSWLKNKIFPYDDIKLSIFEGWLKTLVGIHSVFPFSENGEKYYYIKNFQTHQFINRPSKTRNPEPPTNINDSSLINHGVLHDDSSQEGEGEGEGEKEGESPPEDAALHKKDFLSSIKSNPAYTHIDIDTELSKMDAWLSLPKNKNRKKTPQFVLRWLNKIEKPLSTGGFTNGAGGIPPTDGMERKLWELKRIREREEKHPESSKELH
jgi:hypothetical protein